MKLLSIFLLTFFPISAQAITWKEFWEPFANAEDDYHYHRHYYVICKERIYHEEYVPGNSWRSGYVKKWYETVTVPCY